MRKFSLTAIFAIGVFTSTLLSQTRRPAAPQRDGPAAQDTIVPATPRNAPGKLGWVNTRATKDDWEEINFEFNSSIITDGFPTLLWLADYLRANAAYRVMITGHTDYIGGVPYNERLALARANAVKAFLVKYGATDGQITANGEGERNPELDNSTKEHRWVNRRVTITVTDQGGKKMSLEDLISSKYKNAAPPAATAAQAPGCCDEILKRLDNLASLLNELKNMEQAEHAKLQKDIDDVRNQVAGVPNKETVTEIARKEGDVTANKAAQQAFEKGVTNNRKFSLLGLNIGPTYGPGRTGSFTFSGRGQFFSPFGNGKLPDAFGTHAVQAQGEYLYYPGRQEGQFDIGLVNRWDRLQMGLFSSFKYVNFREFQSGGTLGQAALVIDYLFSRGRIGVFGTKGFKDNAVLNRVPLGNTSFMENYLKIVNQVGANAQVGLVGKSYLEGNLGYLESHMPGSSGRPGGMLRFVGPLNDFFAFTVEAGLNETYLAPKNSGRLVFGIEFGSWMRPGQFMQTTQPVPMEIPRVRYELLTRHTGNSAPVADAGPDQIGVAAGEKTLDGSASTDPDSDTLAFHWDQISGTAVSLSGANTAKATFNAAEGETYIFRLTVTDPGGLKSTARTTVGTVKNNVRIIQFSASPANIAPGETSKLTWSTENAKTVTINGIGAVAANGTSNVSPQQTTTYTLTAIGADGTQVNATTTVTVGNGNGPRIVNFQASPTEILAGDKSTLTWNVENSTKVNISGVGDVNASGSTTVSPTETTTYTLTATNAQGTSTATAMVTVGTGVKILNFTVNPTVVGPGLPATLTWSTENASSAVITGVGSVPVNGSIQVNPMANTIYTLIAYGRLSNASADVLLNVKGTSSTPGGPVCNIQPDLLTFVNTVALDASHSMSPSGLPLMFSFTQVSGPRQANVSNGTGGMGSAYMFAYGVYVFQVTVTDASGQTCSATTNVNFVDP
jgi:outer membrane protein OmpA-like peptidoglycan-associated protein